MMVILMSELFQKGVDESDVIAGAVLFAFLFSIHTIADNVRTPD